MSTRTRGYAHRVDIAAPASRVWTALIEPKLLSRWMGPGPRVRPRVGGSFAATLMPDIPREASIDVFEPGRRLRLVYLLPPGFPEFDGAVVDDYLLEKEGENTIVRLLGSGLPEGGPWDAYYMKLRVHSERSLARLKLLLERKIKTGDVL
ncbi:MAG: SRPBCC domain-containing protein [Pseudomonadota bacterium]